MTNFEQQHPRVGDGTFTDKTQTAPDVAIAATGRELSSLPVGTDAARAATLAAAGGHHTMFYYDAETADTVDELVAEIARLSGGKRVVVIEPDMTASDLIGSPNKPGLLEQADGAVLLVRDAPDHRASTLDLIRGPLTNDTLMYTHAGVSHSITSRFQLVLTANAAPLDTDGMPMAIGARRRYFSRVSGPILDRVDAQVKLTSEVPDIDPESLDESIAAAQATSAARLEGTPWKSNADVSGIYMRGSERRLPEPTRANLDRALERGGITMRGYDSALRKAWTMADLAGDVRPTREQVDIAIQMRRANV